MKTKNQKVPKEWTNEELKTLQILMKEGKDLKHISQVLLRTIKDVREKMKEIKMITKEVKIKDSKKIQESVSTREKAKEMARVARQIARANGKRITMAMFFIEDFKD